MRSTSLTPSRPARSRPAGTRACRHHWLLQSLAEAGAFPARCRRCGARRSFPVTDYDDAALALRLQDLALLGNG